MTNKGSQTSGTRSNKLACRLMTQDHYIEMEQGNDEHRPGASASVGTLPGEKLVFHTESPCMYQRLRIAAATLSAATAIVLSGHDVARCDIQRIDIKRSDVRAKRKGGITLTPIQCVQHCFWFLSCRYTLQSCAISFPGCLCCL